MVATAGSGLGLVCACPKQKDSLQSSVSTQTLELKRRELANLYRLQRGCYLELGLSFPRHGNLPWDLTNPRRTGLCPKLDDPTSSLFSSLRLWPATLLSAASRRPGASFFSRLWSCSLGPQAKAGRLEAGWQASKSASSQVIPRLPVEAGRAGRSQVRSVDSTDGGSGRSGATPRCSDHRPLYHLLYLFFCQVIIFLRSL